VPPLYLSVTTTRSLRIMLCNRFDGRTGNAGVVGRAAPRQFSVEEVLRFDLPAFLSSSICAVAGVTIGSFTRLS